MPNDVKMTLRRWLSAGCLIPLHELERSLNRAKRRTYLFYRQGLRFRRRTRAWSGEQKNEWLLGRLRSVLRRAYSETDYYRELFGELGFDPHADFTFEDFARLPPLEREAVREHEAAMVSRVLPEHLRRLDMTGGSTGVPTRVWIGPEEMGWGEAGIQHFFRRLGLRRGASVALFWGHHLDPVQREGMRDMLRDLVQNTHWFDCMRLSPETLERYHTDMEHLGPDGIVAYANALGQLAEEAAKRGWSPTYPNRCFVTGAEKLQPEHRRLIEEVFGRPVYERYGGRDVGMLAYQAEVSESLDFEVDWPFVFVEPETEGESSSILVTKLRADAMPMIRYRVGDVAKFPSSARPGQPALRLQAVLGREADRVWLPDGRWISGIVFPHLFKDFSVDGFQVIQSADYDVTVNIVPGSEFDDATRTAIISTLEFNLPSVPIEIRLVDEIERTRANKLRPVQTFVRPVRAREEATVTS